MSPASEIESTEPSELIYVPNNSWGPIIVAAGLALLLVGLFKGWFIILVGVFILLLGLRSWWRLSNDEISRMRREQQTDTAVIPAEPVRHPALTAVLAARVHSHAASTPAAVRSLARRHRDVAPADVQTRMMSRIERTPTTSGPSTITRWRMPRLAMSAAARSRLQSGFAVITESLMWSPTRSLSGS